VHFSAVLYLALRPGRLSAPATPKNLETRPGEADEVIGSLHDHALDRRLDTWTSIMH
jgi:hypothetical protein